MIPEEDRGPAWLRDYGFTDFGDIAADINAMKHYAQKLAADVQDNYSPHLNGLSAKLATPLPVADPSFYELNSFIESHKAVQAKTESNVWAYADGTHVFASAAQEISHKYQGTDAFAHAKLVDVQKALSTSPPAATSSGGDA
jgi:hypothetical protein